jgi:hypothetical protein
MASIRQEDMAQFCSDTDRWRHWLLRALLLYTPGIDYLIDNGAAWLIDAIASYLPDKRVAGNPKLKDAQFWTFQVDLERHTAVLFRCDGDNPARMIEQAIEYTDFPLPEIRVWVQANGDGTMTAMLPGEY